ncbi:MAG: hypothetical protein ABI579_08115 [Candidatus Sumerlaeota bacterium]
MKAPALLFILLSGIAVGALVATTRHPDAVDDSIPAATPLR